MGHRSEAQIRLAASSFPPRRGDRRCGLCIRTNPTDILNDDPLRNCVTPVDKHGEHTRGCFLCEYGHKGACSLAKKGKNNLPIAGASSSSTTIDNVKDGNSDYKAARAARLARKIQLCPWISENYGQIDDSKTDELEPVGPGEVAVMLPLLVSHDCIRLTCCNVPADEEKLALAHRIRGLDKDEWLQVLPMLEQGEQCSIEFSTTSEFAC